MAQLTHSIHPPKGLLQRAALTRPEILPKWCTLSYTLTYLWSTFWRIHMKSKFAFKMYARMVGVSIRDYNAYNGRFGDNTFTNEKSLPKFLVRESKTNKLTIKDMLTMISLTILWARSKTCPTVGLMHTTKKEISKRNPASAGSCKDSNDESGAQLAKSNHAASIPYAMHMTN